MAGEPFTKIPHKLIKSERWQNLSAGAVKLLVDICAWHNGFNNGEIGYGVRRAMELLDCSKPTACKRLKELREAGIIERVKKGSFASKAAARKGLVSTWRVTFLKNQGER